MREGTIEDLAVRIKNSGKDKLPIFFLGAGASKSGGIPLAAEIAQDILEKYKDLSAINRIEDKNKTYSNLMAALMPNERNDLLKGYIDQAKINVTHLYLAQLIHQKLVDYVMTVNFDNLMLKALALFNEFPPIHDMAILKELTTAPLEEQSVIFLHGQYRGVLTLNTEEEMGKVEKIIPSIFHGIMDRTWIFIGYSGNDPIFEQIQKLGNFTKGVYWITYNDNEPEGKVKEFLNKADTNASLIKGYDADSFMLKLSVALDLKHLKIIDYPFSSLQGMLGNIVDIDNEEHFKGVRERLKITQKQVAQAIDQFEKGKSPHKETAKEDYKIDTLKKEVINILLTERYQEEKIEELANKIDIVNDSELNTLLAELYFNWGVDLGNLAQMKEGTEAEILFQEAIDKCQKAIEIKPDKHEAFYNWGVDLGKLAQMKEGEEAETLFKEAIGKYQKAVEIKPDLHQAFYNWGTVLGKLAQIKKGEALLEEAILAKWLSRDSKRNKREEVEALFQEGFDKYQKAIEIKPDKHEAFSNWGVDLGNLAQMKEGVEAEALFQEGFDKYQKAIEIKPDLHQVFYNWGVDLGKLAQMKEGAEAEVLFQEASDKYQKAVEIKPDKHEAFSNWGVDLGKLAQMKEGEEAEALFQEAFDKYQKAVEIKPDKHEAFSNWGVDLGKLAQMKEGEEAETLFKEAIDKYQKAIEIKPNYHKAFYNWGNDLMKLAQMKEGAEAEALFQEAIDKFQKAVEIKPDFHEAFYNWGNDLMKLALMKEGAEAEALLQKAIDKYQRGVELGGSSYNLACLYAVKGEKGSALEYLTRSLAKGEIGATFVENDEDWKELLDDRDFIALLDKYKKQ